MGEMICPNCKPNFTNDEGAWAGVVSCPYHSLMDKMVKMLTVLVKSDGYPSMKKWHEAEQVLAKARAAKAGGQ